MTAPVKSAAGCGVRARGGEKVLKLPELRLRQDDCVGFPRSFTECGERRRRSATLQLEPDVLAPVTAAPATLIHQSAVGETMSDDTTFLRRVVLSNYRSIAACDVRLGPLRFLVGPNGSGKSNFLDALRFVADSLQTSVDHALRERGGIA